jgi:ribosome-associated heat shock protein Hsp15
MFSEVRIDKYLWAVRIFKTRNIATEECKKGHILINNVHVKPSRIVKINEQIDIKFPPIIRSFVVEKVIEKRVSAILAKEAITEITSESELAKLKTAHNTFVCRASGTGRPTKKERRAIDKFNETDFE